MCQLKTGRVRVSPEPLAGPHAWTVRPLSASIDDNVIKMPSLHRSLPRNLSMDVVDALSQRIRIGPLRAGDKLPTEAEIMSEFGVSRTVVREALSRLQAAGMVRSRRGVGTFVVGASGAKPFQVDSSPDDSLPQALALIELRIGLESEAAALAAQRRDGADLAAIAGALNALRSAMAQGMDTAVPDFQLHLQISRAAHSPHFAAVLEALGPACVPTAFLEPAGGEDPGIATIDQVLLEHRRIVDAIAQQDADAARAAMRTHLVNGRERRRASELPR